SAGEGPAQSHQGRLPRNGWVLERGRSRPAAKCCVTSRWKSSLSESERERAGAIRYGVRSSRGAQLHSRQLRGIRGAGEERGYTKTEKKEAIFIHQYLHIGSYLDQPPESCSSLCPPGRIVAMKWPNVLAEPRMDIMPAYVEKAFMELVLKGDCHACPAGTFRPTSSPGDISSCLPCPDINQVSLPGSTSLDQCICKTDFRELERNASECPPLNPPEHGYFVNGGCSRVFNAACGIRCDSGYKLQGSSIRLCAENGSWTGEDASCIMKTCPALSPPRHGSMMCNTPDNGYSKRNASFLAITDTPLWVLKKRTCLAISLWDGLQALCRHIESPVIKCPEDIVLDADESDASAMVEWPTPHTYDNSGEPVILTVIPAIVSPRRFDIGIAIIHYAAEDRARNRARCNFTVTVRDVQPPTIDRCVSPSIIILEGPAPYLQPGKNLCSLTTGKTRQHMAIPREASILSSRTTDVIYEVKDESGNNNTCVIVITVQGV
ncbi:sushi, von Willebrand factor type A, EGF and pentraxin domain-containing protein 1, partial [Caerostris extrusa]